MDLGVQENGFRFEVLPPYLYWPIMANASSMELLTSSGVDPKTAKALGEFVERTVNKSIEKAVDNAVEKALKSFEIAARSRPQEAAQRPSSKAIPVLTGIIALAAVVTVQLGTIYWLSDFIRSEISDVRSEVSDVRSEISELRSDIREDFRSVEAKIDVLRSEVGALRERVTGIEDRVTGIEERVTGIQERLPAAP